MNEEVGPIRVLLVDDHAVVRSGLRLLLESRPGIKVVGEAADRIQTLRLASEARPDVVLLDLDLGAEEALHFLPDILRHSPGSRVILLTALREPETFQRAVELGALGIVHKETAADVLIKAIEKVHGGETWLDRALTAKILEKAARDRASFSGLTEKISTLTRREREIIGAVAEGLKNKEIGKRLFISETTVRHHLTSIFSKLGVSDRLELLIYAYRCGLVKKP